MPKDETLLYAGAGVAALGVVWYLNRAPHVAIATPTTPDAPTPAPGTRPTVHAALEAAWNGGHFAKEPHMTHAGKAPPDAYSTKTLTLFQWNADFNRSPAAHARAARILLQHGAQAIAGEELWSTDKPHTYLADLFPGYKVTQGREGWRSMGGIAVDPRFKSGPGRIRLGIPHIPGVKLNARPIVERTVVIDGRKATLMEVHFPPERFPTLWPLYAVRLRAAILAAPHPPIVSGDWNSRLTGAQVERFARAAGLRRYGTGIDGFLYSPDFRITHHVVIPAGVASDHPVVGATFAWAHK